MNLSDPMDRILRMNSNDVGSGYGHGMKETPHERR